MQRPQDSAAVRVESRTGQFHDALNEQIGREFAASQQYAAIAVYYDSETLPQLAQHFYRQALEERNHAMIMVQYLLDSGEPSIIPGVEAPETAFADAVAPVRLALEQEKRVTDDIVRIAGIAREDNDLVGEQFLHWFLEEQREEVASMSSLLAVVERSQDNLLLVEEYLARTGALAGEPSGSAPAALVRHYDGGLRALAYRLLGDRDRMDDVLQETYVRAFRGLPGFRGRSRVGTWLYRIAYNACLDELGRAGRVVHLPLADVAEPADPRLGVAETVAWRRDLAAALAELAPADRAAVLMVDAQGFGYRDAGEVLGVPEGTVASRLNRARAALRRALEDPSEGVSGG